MIIESVEYNKFQGASQHQYTKAVEIFNKAFSAFEFNLKLSHETISSIVELFFSCKERCKSYSGIGGSFWLATAIEDMNETEKSLQLILQSAKQVKDEN